MMIQCTDAIIDEPQQRWISDAQVAQIDDTASISRPKAQHVRARLIVRRVKDMNPNNQSELFTAYRSHAVFTNSPPPMLAGREGPPRPHAWSRSSPTLRTGRWHTCPPDTSGPTAPANSPPLAA